MELLYKPWSLTSKPVLNIKGFHYQVAKIKELENVGFQQKLNSFDYHLTSRLKY